MELVLVLVVIVVFTLLMVGWVRYRERLRGPPPPDDG